MKIGYDSKKQVFYVADYNKSLKKVVVLETSKDFDSLAMKYKFVSENLE